jgi:uncharacterized protein
MPNFGVTLINYAVYALGQNSEFLGMADLTLPDIQMEVASIKGAGVFGTVDHPVLGHTADMTATLNFHTPARSAINLLQQRGRQLDCRGAVEIYDSGEGSITPEACRVVMFTLPKGLTLGSFEVAAPTGTAVTLTVVACTIYIGDDRVFEHDKYNTKFEVEGNDYGEGVRRILGR